MKLTQDYDFKVKYNSKEYTLDIYVGEDDKEPMHLDVVDDSSDITGTIESYIKYSEIGKVKYKDLNSK